MCPEKQLDKLIQLGDKIVHRMMRLQQLIEFVKKICNEPV